jgi:uncharacterized protein DUF4167
MRHNNRRMKNRTNNNTNAGSNGHRRSNTPPRMQVFDSNGPDVRIRGTAWQVHEKYLALSKDAAAIGDVVMAESYSQHAEHYQRIINSFGEQISNWTPQAQNDEGMEMDGNQGQVMQQQQPQQQQQQQQQAPRQEMARRDDGRTNSDLGLPTSLFKPTPAPVLETA